MLKIFFKVLQFLAVKYSWTLILDRLSNVTFKVNQGGSFMFSLVSRRFWTHKFVQMLGTFLSKNTACRARNIYKI